MYLLQRGEKNGKATWSLRWEVRDPGTGKRGYVYETFRGPRRAAERHWMAKEAEIRKAGAGYVKPAKDTLGEWLDRWLRDYAEQHCKATTARSYREIVALHITPALGAVPLRDLTAAQVAGWVADVQRKEVRGKTLSPRRVAYVRAVLRNALQEAVRLELIPSNPVDKVRAPRQAPKEINAFDVAEVRALASAAKGQRLEALYGVAWQSGLQWGDVDLDARTLRVRRNLVDLGKGGGTSKTPRPSGASEPST